MNRALKQWLESVAGEAIAGESGQPVAGGCIHQSKLFCTVSGQLIFVKSNSSDCLAMFEAEARGLRELASTQTVRIPRPMGSAVIEDSAFFAMEGIELFERSDQASQERLGRAVAGLHTGSVRLGDRYGFEFDNFIGATPQLNGPMDSWADFFVQRRLKYQFQLARRKGLRIEQEEEFRRLAHSALRSRQVEPALLHGDLWGGNVSFAGNGDPVLFDPAVYYGDREADIAFTGFFGGFSAAFYRAYREFFPEPEPWLHDLYNLYHVLNHFHLFGGGYGDSARRMVADLIGRLT